MRIIIHHLRTTTLCFSAIASAACGGDPTVAGRDEPERAQESRQGLWLAKAEFPWSPQAWANSMVGVSISPSSVVHTWYNDGWVCKGTETSLCGYSMEQYSAGGKPFTLIKGVGIAKNTGQVYAWYLADIFGNGVYSRGTSTNLTQHSQTFLPFTKPGQFTMDQLVEVDNSDNGQWYYYWRDANNVIWRTTGTSNNATLSGPFVVTTAISQHGTIVGISFDGNTPAKIKTHYFDGSLNMSSNSLDLQQP